MTRLHRQRVVRADGRAINVVQRRAHLSYRFTGCCCGRTERDYAAVPVDTFKDEWLTRKLRHVRLIYDYIESMVRADRFYELGGASVLQLLGQAR